MGMPRKNITWERHIFNSRSQQPGEKIDQYLTDLAAKPNHVPLTESLIRDRIVCGVISNQSRSRLLKQTDFTLEGVVDICRADEATSEQMKSL